MASTINIPAYSDALVVLGTAGVVVPMLRYVGLSSVLGYLGAGALLGPLGLGQFIGQYPIVYWFTVVDSKDVAAIADLGVVFLLFLVGIELSYERLMSMRRLVFGLGMLQVVVSAALIAAVAASFGQKPAIALMIGACLGLSSTALVLDVLTAQGRLKTNAGRASFSVLLAQDLAVVPILMFVSILGSDINGSIFWTIGAALVRALAAVAIIVVVGRLFLRPLFRIVGISKSAELLLAAVLFVIIGTGVVAAVAGLSMALGAFVAGLLLAETEYRKAIEAIIEPFKGLLLGVFFFTVGMAIDMRTLANQPLQLCFAVLSVVVLKAIVLALLGRLFKLPWRASIEAGMLLGPGGEFAFVGLGMAATLGLIPPNVSTYLFAITSLSMVLIPPLAFAGRKLSAWMEPVKPVNPALAAQPRSLQNHTIVVGYGRVGKVVAAMLAQHKLPFTATDHDARMVTQDRSEGHEVFFGDASSPAFLLACGLMEAAGVVITINIPAVVDEIVREVRQLRPDVLIVARARDADHARHLYAVGVTDAVPETIEASLQISEAALLGLGVAAGYVIGSIHERRDVFRHELRQSALAVGQNPPRLVRKKGKR